MKKELFVAILVALCFSTQLSAQSEDNFKRHELRLGYGSPSFYTVGYNLGLTLFNAPFASITGTEQEDDVLYVGPISASYEYHFNKHWSVGGIASYEYMWSKGRLEKPNGTIIGYYDKSLNFASLMAKVQVQYGFNLVKFYHALYGGGMLIVEKYKNEKAATGFAAAFHVTAIGVKIGPPSCQFFIDAGFGSLGMVNAGVALQF